MRLKFVGGGRKASSNPADLAKQATDGPADDHPPNAADAAIEQAFKMGRHGIILAQAGRWAGRPKIDSLRRAAEEAIEEILSAEPSDVQVENLREELEKMRADYEDLAERLDSLEDARSADKVGDGD